MGVFRQKNNKASASCIHIYSYMGDTTPPCKPIFQFGTNECYFVLHRLCLVPEGQRGIAIAKSQQSNNQTRRLSYISPLPAPPPLLSHQPHDVCCWKKCSLLSCLYGWLLVRAWRRGHSLTASLRALVDLVDLHHASPAVIVPPSCESCAFCAPHRDVVCGGCAWNTECRVVCAVPQSGALCGDTNCYIGVCGSCGSVRVCASVVLISRSSCISANNHAASAIHSVTAQPADRQTAITPNTHQTSTREPAS